MSAVSFRAPREGDASAIAALVASIETARYGAAETTEDDIRFVWSWPRFDLERDAWLAVSESTVAGYAWIWGPRLPSPGYDARLVLPRDLPTEAAEGLLERVEARVLESARAHLTEPPRIAVLCSSLDQVQRATLERRGYALVRTYLRMERALDGAWSAPSWPDTTEVAAFRPGHDERALHAVLQDSFSEHYRFIPESFEDWRARNIGHSEFAPALSFIVWHGGEVVAASTNFRSGESGIIGILGVRRPWRRLGLARALLLHSFSAFRAAGLKAAWLGVDAENADRAVALYEGVGMRITRQELLYESRLSPR